VGPSSFQDATHPLSFILQKLDPFYVLPVALTTELTAVLTKVGKTRQAYFCSFDFLLQRPALFGFRQTATSDLGKRSTGLSPCQIPGELPVSCTAFAVAMLRFRNNLAISGQVCWSKTNDLDVESSSVVFA